MFSAAFCVSVFIDSLPAIASQPSGATCYDTRCAFFHKLTGATCYDTCCAFLCKLTGAKCYDTRLCFSLQAHRSKVLRHVVVPFSSANHWNNVLRHTLCFSFRKPLEQHVTTHVVLSLQLKASRVCDSHFTRILCRYAVLSRVQVTLRLCRTFSGFLGHSRKFGIATWNL